MPRTVSVYYKPLNDLDKPFPDVAREVIVSDDWSMLDVAEWFTKRHSYINGVGIKVFDVVQK